MCNIDDHEKHWIVIDIGEKGWRLKHKTRGEAEVEAKKLAERYRTPFMVYESATLFHSVSTIEKVDLNPKPPTEVVDFTKYDDLCAK